MAKETPQEAAKEVAAEIKELGDKLVALTVLQARDLKDYLKDEYDIEAAAGGVGMFSPAGGAAAGDKEAEEKTSFDVVLTGVGDRKIPVIKVVRDITSLGLKEAKELVDNVPKPVKEGVTREEADQIKAKLEEAGAAVEIK